MGLWRRGPLAKPVRPTRLSTKVTLLACFYCAQRQNYGRGKARAMPLPVLGLSKAAGQVWQRMGIEPDCQAPPTARWHVARLLAQSLPAGDSIGHVRFLPFQKKCVLLQVVFICIDLLERLLFCCKSTDIGEPSFARGGLWLG